MRLKSRFIGLCALFVVSSLAHAASVLFEDHFDGENGGVGALNYANFANWNVTRGTVDLIGNGFFDYYPGNGLFVDLDGSSFAGGRMESQAAFTLAPGVYELRFDIGNDGGNPGDINTVIVSWGTLYSESFTRTGFPPLETIVRTIPVSAQTLATLVFDQDGADNGGIVIDNVQITAVPEPSSGLLSLTGLGIVLAVAMRRRARCCMIIA